MAFKFVSNGDPKGDLWVCSTVCKTNYNSFKPNIFWLEKIIFKFEVHCNIDIQFFFFFSETTDSER